MKMACRCLFQEGEVDMEELITDIWYARFKGIQRNGHLDMMALFGIGTRDTTAFARSIVFYT